MGPEYLGSMHRLILLLNLAAIATIAASKSSVLLTAISPYGGGHPITTPSVRLTRADSARARAPHARKLAEPTTSASLAASDD